MVGSLPLHAGALITSVIMVKVSGTAGAAVTNPELTASVGKEAWRALRHMTQELGITKKLVTGDFFWSGFLL